MIRDDEAPLDPAQEDRTVDYLRARGVFGGRGVITIVEASPADARTRSRWRIPMLAAAAAAVIAFISLFSDFSSRAPSAPASVATAPSRILVWY